MGNQPHAVFRADASAGIGGGHIMRCLALADELMLAGWSGSFACRDGTAETVAALDRSDYPIHPVDGGPREEAAALRARWPQGCRLLVVDSYAHDAAFETACRGWANTILAIDDVNDRAHDCDALLNQNLGWAPVDYAALLPATASLFLGPDYALLRPQFAEIRRTSIAARSANSGLRRILVVMGNFDPDNATETALRGIEESGLNVEIDVVLGATAPHIQAVQARIAVMAPVVRLHLSVTDMAALMAASDLAIGAGGSTSWERCALGLPTLLMVLADNQHRIATELVDAGAALSLGLHQTVTPGAIAASLKLLAMQPARLRQMSECAAAICDGEGARRLASVAIGVSETGECRTRHAQ